LSAGLATTPTCKPAGQRLRAASCRCARQRIIAQRL
jgi:hypothetical protein